MRQAIDLAGFERKFREHPDPWRTWTAWDEAVKRAAILRALGPVRHGWVLELGSGNGSNSRVLAGRALKLDAVDGTPAGVSLTAEAIRALPGAVAHLLPLPGRLPRPAYHAVVIAELLYYLTPRDMGAVARAVAAALPRGGRLVLAHHQITFADAAQPPNGVHTRFLRATGTGWALRRRRVTAHWRVEGFLRGNGSLKSVRMRHSHR